MGYFSRSLGVNIFQRDRGVHDCILGVTFCEQKYLKKSMINEWYYERKRKFIKWALIWCSSLTSEKLVNIKKKTCWSSGICRCGQLGFIY